MYCLHRVSACVILFAVASGILGAARPAAAGEAKTIARTSCLTGETGGAIGVSVKLFGYLTGTEAGHTYDLRYQLRLHQKKGVVGPLLATRATPQGAAHTVASVTAAQGAKFNLDLNATADIVRKDLRDVTNFPTSKLHQEVLVRVEPQIFDRTSGKYLTPYQTDAIILVVHLWNNRVSHIEFFGEWLTKKCFHTDIVLARYATLDKYQPSQNFIDAAFEKAVARKNLPSEKRIKLVNAIPKEFIGGKNNLHRVLEDLRKTADGELKAAIDRKLK